MKTFRLPLLALICLIAPILFTYALYAEHAGRYFAESLPSGQTRHPAIACRSERIDTVAGLHRLPHFAVPDRPDAALRNGLQKLRSIAYSPTLNIVYALDSVDEIDIRFLTRHQSRLGIDPSALARFIDAASRNYAPCPYDPDFATQITTAYWASVEAAKIHHWAHLYEGALGLDGRPQYGRLVPYLANLWAKLGSDNGPSAFATRAWWVFMCFAIAYALLLQHIAREAGTSSSPAIVAIGFKVALFHIISPFMMLLAPGFHWFREFVFLAIGCTFFCRMHTKRWLLIAGSLPLLYLLDPTYLALALVCAATSLILTRLDEISAHLGKAGARFRRAALPLAILAIPLVLAGIWHNLHYIAVKIGNLDVNLIFASRHLGFPWLYTTILLLIAGGALASVIHSARSRRPLHCYFGLISIAGMAYFATMPGKPHFLKCIEYTIPLLMLFAIDGLRGRTALIVRAVTALSAIGMLFVLSLGYKNENLLKPYHDMGNYRNIQLFGRTATLDINEATERHIAAFPSRVQRDFIVSPYDKHLLMLQDAANGWPYLDWYMANGQVGAVTTTLETIARRGENLGRVVTVIFDRKLLTIDPQNGFRKWATDYYSVENTAPRLSLKSRIQSFEIAHTLWESCMQQTLADSEDWVILRCAPEPLRRLIENSPP